MQSRGFELGGTHYELTSPDRWGYSSLGPANDFLICLLAVLAAVGVAWWMGMLTQRRK